MASPNTTRRRPDRSPCSTLASKVTIVRTIAVNHGGQVRLDSAEGEGTAVRLVLPVDGRSDARPPSAEPVVSGRGP
jgi:light-regulated signal transduction histidine kinase (bacteriophytochrome)